MTPMLDSRIITGAMLPPCHESLHTIRSALGRKPERQHRGRRAPILALDRGRKSSEGAWETSASTRV